MKKIEAVIDPARLDDVVRALAGIGVDGLTMAEIRTRATGRAVAARYRGADAITMDLAASVKLEIVVADYKASQVVETVRRAARAGSRDDGTIVVVPLVDALRIRTGETGDDAL